MNPVEEIKQRLDIVDVISESVTLQRSGRNYRALCPFHAEKAPSFFVFPDKQTWHCFGGCATGGDVFAFIMKKEALDFSGAMRVLAEKAGISLGRKSGAAEETEKDRLATGERGIRPLLPACPAQHAGRRIRPRTT